MSYKDKNKRKEYNKEYYKTHKDDILANQKEYYKDNKDDIIAYKKQYYKDNKDDILAKQKEYYKDNKDDIIAYKKQYYKDNKDDILAKQKLDTNSAGVPKINIRSSSSSYLQKTLKFQKIKGYENHHCFGYENNKDFIYIPRYLHKSVIHPFLRKNKIDADSDHFEQIKHLLDNCKEKIYIIKDGKITEYN